MSIRKVFGIVALFAALAAGVIALARVEDADGAPPRARSGIPVAVVDFEIRNLDVVGASVADEFAARLAQTARVQLAATRQMKSVALGTDGLDPAAISAIVTATRAQYIIVGRLFTAGGSMYAAVKIIDTDSGEMYGKAVKGPPDAAVGTLLRRLADDVATVVAALPAKAAAPREVARPLLNRADTAALQSPSAPADKPSPSAAAKPSAPSKPASGSPKAGPPPRTNGQGKTAKPPPR